MQTSAQGVAALEREEGVVLRAYRDAVGVWTIGAGLTAASGVVKPTAGMVISAATATNLLQEALRKNYEPTVEAVMGGGQVRHGLKQHEFDAGVSFHFNTGAIRKASWVGKWRAGASRHDITASLALWNKAGGKVLPGLVSRRAREASMLLDGVYTRLPTPQPPPSPAALYAKWGIALTSTEKAAAVAAFAKLGYDTGTALDAVLASAARKFQADHGLTVDGIIGRATLSTLQRRLDAPKAATKPVAAGAAAASLSLAAPFADLALPMDGAGLAAFGLSGLWAMSSAWRYRDVLAAKVAPALPRLATFLRSF